jgi:FixJ family two-component response regulator
MQLPLVHIVDDDDAVRESLGLLCESAGLVAIGHPSAESFLSAYSVEQRGCLVLDVKMGRMSGPELHEELTRRGTRLGVIYLTGQASIPMTVRAIKAGAVDVLTKPVNGEVLLQSIHAALARSKEDECAPTEHDPAATRRVATLTAHERDVMTLAVQGLDNAEIAERLGTCCLTVEFHKLRAMHKTGAATTSDLARIARASGMGPRAGAPLTRP